MSPALLAVIISMVEEAIKVEPQIAGALKNIFSKPAPTAEDWQAIKTAVMSQSYEQLVPHTSLDGTQTTSNTP